MRLDGLLVAGREFEFRRSFLRNNVIYLMLTLIAFSVTAYPTIFGSVRGVIHDPQHRPVQGAMVMLKAKFSDWSRSANTDSDGQFALNAVPIGEYSISVVSPGFAQTTQDILVASGSEPVLHFELRVAARSENVTVSAAPEAVPTDTVTPTTLVSRVDVQRTPGADRTNSLAIITDFVPGAGAKRPAMRENHPGFPSYLIQRGRGDRALLGRDFVYLPPCVVSFRFLMKTHR